MKYVKLSLKLHILSLLCKYTFQGQKDRLEQRECLGTWARLADGGLWVRQVSLEHRGNVAQWDQQALQINRGSRDLAGPKDSPDPQAKQVVTMMYREGQ